MAIGQSWGGQFRGIYVCVAALVAVLALTVMSAQAKAASPVLEFAVPGNDFPVDFEADGGEVTAVLAGYDTIVHCDDSHGEGQILGPRSTVSTYEFTGCETQTGTEGGSECKSVGANDEEITAADVEAQLVFIDQAKHEVGMLLNPGEGTYMEFECGGDSVTGSGPFLSPVGPINKEATSFTATLSRSGAAQTPSEYENAIGEKRPAIPKGQRNANPVGTTGVELSFAIETSVPIEIKAITAAEIEAKQREEEAAVAKKRQDEEAAAAAAAKKRQEEEAALAVAAQELQEEKAKLKRLRRVLLSSTLTQCRKAHSKQKRMRCEKRAKKKYGSAKLR